MMPDANRMPFQCVLKITKNDGARNELDKYQLLQTLTIVQSGATIVDHAFKKYFLKVLTWLIVLKFAGR